MFGRFTEYIKAGRETQWLELKAYKPPRGKDQKVADMIKEVLAMSNSGHQGYILFGVNDDANRLSGGEDVPGIEDNTPDDQVEREINDQLRNYCEPSIVIRYVSYQHGGKKIGVLTVPKSRTRRHMVFKNNAHGLRRGEYFLRRGTVIDVVTPHDWAETNPLGDASPVTVLNFSHPLTARQIAQLEQMLGCHVECVWPDGKVDLDNDAAFGPQIQDLLDSLGYRTEDWECTGKFIVCLPGLSEAAAVLLSEIHARMGGFPTIVRRKPVAKPTGTEFEIAEVIDLTQVRAATRERGAHLLGRRDG